MRHLRLQQLVKIVALLTCLTFVFPSLTWAFEPMLLLPGQIIYKEHSVTIPSQWGTTIASRQGSRRLVVCVQDLHCNYEVQTRIAAIIHLLAQNHGLQLVGVEGAATTLNVSQLSAFPLEAARKRACAILMRDGKITGMEHYAAVGKFPVVLEGLEDARLYQSNLDDLKVFLNDANQGAIYDLREALDGLKLGVYNQDLKALDDHKTNYRNGGLTLASYCAWLAAAAGRQRIPIQAFPNLHLFMSQGGADTDLLFSEMERLDQLLRDPVYTTQDQRDLDSLLQRLDLMEKLLNISATPAELAAFRQQPEAYRTRLFRDFVSRHRSGGEDASDVGSLDEALDKVAAFYRVADQRSQLFVANLDARMTQHHTDLAVMVTGGYHTPEILAELARRGYSYVCVKPRMDHEDVLNPYFDLLRGRPNALERLLAQNQNIFQIERPFTSNRARHEFAREVEQYLAALAVEQSRAGDLEMPGELQRLLAEYNQHPGVEPVNIRVTRVKRSATGAMIAEFNTGVTLVHAPQALEGLHPVAMLGGGLALYDSRVVAAREQAILAGKSGWQAWREWAARFIVRLQGRAAREDRAAQAAMQALVAELGLARPFQLSNFTIKGKSGYTASLIHLGDYGSNYYCVRVGGLFFLDEVQYTELSGSLKNRIGEANIIRLANSRACPLFQTNFRNYTMAAIAALLENADAVAGRRAIDCGSDDGILSLVLARLGAARVDLVEIEEHSNQQAIKNLALNKITNYALHRVSLEQTEEVAKAVGDFPGQTVVVSNIGYWRAQGLSHGEEAYSVTNQNSMDLIGKVPRVAMFIGSGLGGKENNFGLWLEMLKDWFYLKRVDSGFQMLSTHYFAPKVSDRTRHSKHGAWMAMNKAFPKKSADALLPAMGMELDRMIADVQARKTPNRRDAENYARIIAAGKRVYEGYQLYLSGQGKHHAQWFAAAYEEMERGGAPWKRDFPAFQAMAAAIPRVTSRLEDLHLEMFNEAFPDLSYDRLEAFATLGRSLKKSDLESLIAGTSFGIEMVKGCSNMCFACGAMSSGAIRTMPFIMAVKLALRLGPNVGIINPYFDSDPLDYYDPVMGADIADFVRLIRAGGCKNRISLVTNGTNLHPEKIPETLRKLKAADAGIDAKQLGVSIHANYYPVLDYAQKIASGQSVPAAARQRLIERYAAHYLPILQAIAENQLSHEVRVYQPQLETESLLDPDTFQAKFGRTFTTEERNAMRRSQRILREVQSIQAELWQTLQARVAINPKNVAPWHILWFGKAIRQWRAFGVPQDVLETIQRTDRQIVNLSNSVFIPTVNPDGKMVARVSEDPRTIVRPLREIFNNWRSPEFSDFARILRTKARTNKKMSLSGFELNDPGMHEKILADLKTYLLAQDPTFWENEISKITLTNTKIYFKQDHYFDLLRKMVLPPDVVNLLAGNGQSDALTDAEMERLFQTLREVLFPVEGNFEIAFIVNPGIRDPQERFIEAGTYIKGYEYHYHANPNRSFQHDAFTPFSEMALPGSAFFSSQPNRRKFVRLAVSMAETLRMAGRFGFGDLRREAALAAGSPVTAMGILLALWFRLGWIKIAKWLHWPATTTAEKEEMLNQFVEQKNMGWVPCYAQAGVIYGDHDALRHLSVAELRALLLHEQAHALQQADEKRAYQVMLAALAGTLGQNASAPHARWGKFLSRAKQWEEDLRSILDPKKQMKNTEDLIRIMRQLDQWRGRTLRDLRRLRVPGSMVLNGILDRYEAEITGNHLSAKQPLAASIALARPAAPAVNTPLLFEPENILRLPGLQRFWVLAGDYLKVIWSSHAAPVPAQAIRQSQTLRLIAVETCGQVAKLKGYLAHSDQLRVDVPSLRKNGLVNWIRGQITGFAAMDENGRIVFYMPRRVSQAVLAQPDNRDAQKLFQEMVWLAGERSDPTAAWAKALTSISTALLPLGYLGLDEDLYLAFAYRQMLFHNTTQTQSLLAAALADAILRHQDHRSLPQIRAEWQAYSSLCRSWGMPMADESHLALPKALIAGYSSKRTAGRVWRQWQRNKLLNGRKLLYPPRRTLRMQEAA